MHRIFLYVLPFLLFAACQPAQRQTEETGSGDSTLKVHYAKGFTVTYAKSYKKVEVTNPWNENAPNDLYYLVSNEKTETPKDGLKIKIPLQEIAITSNTHIEFLYLLNENQTVKGICSPELIYNNDVLSRYAQNQITNLGDAFNLNFERLLFLKPDAIFVSGYGGQKDHNKRLTQIGIPVVQNNEWTEETPLGRAEWIKFMSVFFDKEKEAEDYFSSIEKQYQALSKKALGTTGKPTVLPGGDFKGTWYMPSGKSYMAKLMADANANYIYQNDSSKGSLPLNFETALLRFQSADIWIGTPAKNIHELTAIDERYALFDCVRRKQVYNFQARTNRNGANDFWESGVAHPEKILADLIKIFHPELLPKYKLFYSQKIN